MARLLSLQKYSADRHRADGMRAGMLMAGDNFGSAEWNRFRYQISRNGEVEELKGGTHRHAAVRRGGIGGFSALGGVALWSWWLNPKSHVYHYSLPYRLALAPWNQVRRGGEGGIRATFYHLGCQFESYVWLTGVSCLVSSTLKLIHPPNGCHTLEKCS